jgi:hypothetical protein
MATRSKRKKEEQNKTKQNKKKHLAPLWTYEGYFLMYTEAKKKTWADFNGTTIITTTAMIILWYAQFPFRKHLDYKKLGREWNSQPPPPTPPPPSPVLWWCPKMSLIGVGVLFPPLSGSYSEQEPTLDGYQGGS